MLNLRKRKMLLPHMCYAKFRHSSLYRLGIGYVLEIKKRMMGYAGRQRSLTILEAKIMCHVALAVNKLATSPRRRRNVIRQVASCRVVTL